MAKQFIIPVEWSVYSTVKVTGVSSVEEAIALVEKHLDDLPLCKDPEYIDGTYHIDKEGAEVGYGHIGDVSVDKDGTIIP
ncbi:MAG: hypothetical protein K6G62_00825 [Eubacterium sp.]|nr:hypothetical protein [Eubacterium sp.]